MHRELCGIACHFSHFYLRGLIVSARRLSRDSHQDGDNIIWSNSFAFMPSCRALCVSAAYITTVVCCFKRNENSRETVLKIKVHKLLSIDLIKVVFMCSWGLITKFVDNKSQP